MLFTFLPCLPGRQKRRLDRTYLKLLGCNPISADCKDFYLLKTQLDLTEYKYETCFRFQIINSLCENSQCTNFRSGPTSQRRLRALRVF